MENHRDMSTSGKIRKGQPSGRGKAVDRLENEIVVRDFTSQPSGKLGKGGALERVRRGVAQEP